MIFLFYYFSFHFAQVVHPNNITIEDVLEMSKKRPTFIFFKPKKSNKNQNIMKLWEKLSSKYMTDKKKVIADFSCYKYRNQCNLMNIKNIPSIYVFYGPEYYMKYNDKYSFSVVDDWVIKMSAYPIKNISSINEIFKEKNHSTNEDSVIFLATKEKDYKKLYEVAYLRNTTNIFFFLQDFNSSSQEYANTSRMTAFLNSNFSISIDENVTDFFEFAQKNQFHVPFQLSVDNIIAAKSSRAYLAIYFTKFKKKQLNSINKKLSELNSSLYNQLKFLGEKYYETTNFCWADIRTFSTFFKRYGITKAPTLLILKDDLFWTTMDTNIDNIISFMDQIVYGLLEGEKVTNIKVVKYDVLLILMRYPMLFFVIIMLLILLFVIIYFIHVHMERLRSFTRFEQKLKNHMY